MAETFHFVIEEWRARSISVEADSLEAARALVDARLASGEIPPFTEDESNGIEILNADECGAVY
jgi:hypothetical protein